jgi:ribosomal protein L16 Arg81 hydroxylase
MKDFLKQITPLLLKYNKPQVFNNAISEVNSLVTWKDLETCMNNPVFYDFDMIDTNNIKVEIPKFEKPWVYNKLVPEKKFLFNKLLSGYSLILLNYGFHNTGVNNLLDDIENILDVNAAAHVYYGLTNSKSFPIHCDAPPNFIIQIEGTTKWKVYDTNVSHDVGLLNPAHEQSLNTVIDITLTPGDIIFIPAKMYHCAYPDNKRISMSIPCWPNDGLTKIDRTVYTI